MYGMDNKTAKGLSHGCELSPIVVFVFHQAANYHLPQFSVLCHKYVIHVCQPRALVMTYQSIVMFHVHGSGMWTHSML